MRALDIKLWRDLRRIWIQSLAIALVLGCGVMVLVLGTGTQRSLTETRDAYYDRHRFADVFASLTRAPAAVIEDIRALDGVSVAEPRIVFGAVLDIAGMAEPATARILSVPPAGLPALNVPLVRKGRMPDPDRPDEVAVSEPFGLANGLEPGSRVRAILNGRMRELVVTGHVLSPEFVYTMGAGAMMPDDRHFGLIWMSESAAAAATDLQGAFNDVTIRLARGADQRAVIAGLDRILAPYGGTGVYGRERQMSDTFLRGELQQLGAMSLVLPPVFLVISAFLVNMVLGRLIALDRSQIGLMKAVGYGTGAIARHYLKMSLGIGVLGVALGWGAGWWLGRYMTGLYTEFFRFPWLVYDPGAWPVAVSGLMGMGTVVLGALRAVARAVALPPAIAMLPPPPPVFRRGWVDAMGRALRLRQTTMMILRSIARWPGRAMVTVFGVTASVSVLVASFFTFDAIDAVMEEVFGHANRQDVTLTLDRARNDRVVQDALALPGVTRAEGALMLPVRLSHGTRSELVGLSARAPDTQLTRLMNDAGEVVTVPDHGLLLPEGLARKLAVAPGDALRVELLAPPRETWDIPVAAVVQQSLGQEAHIAPATLFALMRSAPQVNTINLSIDSAAEAALARQVKVTPAVAGYTLWTDVRAQFVATVNENMYLMIVVYGALGVLITIGVIYNAARIQLAERAHELASLRVLGFTRAEVGYVLVGEQMLLTLVAVPPGWVAGYLFAALMVEGFSTDIVSLPLRIDRATYAAAALIVVGTALAAALLVRRRLDRVDIASALKQKE